MNCSIPGTEQKNLFIVTPKGLYELIGNDPGNYQQIRTTQELNTLGLQKLTLKAYALANTYHPVKIKNKDLTELHRELCKQNESPMSLDGKFFLMSVCPSEPLQKRQHFIITPAGLYQFNGSNYDLIMRKEKLSKTSCAISILVNQAKELAKKIYSNEMSLTLNEILLLDKIPTIKPIRCKPLYENYIDNNKDIHRMLDKDMFADISFQLRDVIKEDLDVLRKSSTDIFNECVYQRSILPKLASIARRYTSKSFRPDDDEIQEMLTIVKELEEIYQQQLADRQKYLTKKVQFNDAGLLPQSKKACLTNEKPALLDRRTSHKILKYDSSTSSGLERDRKESPDDEKQELPPEASAAANSMQLFHNAKKAKKSELIDAFEKKDESSSFSASP